MSGAISARVSTKPALRSSETEPEVGTSSITTVPVLPILSTMYLAPWMPISLLSPETRYTPLAAISMSKLTTVTPLSMAAWIGTSMPCHCGKATMAWAPQVSRSSSWVVISSALELVYSLYSTVSASSLQRFSA